MKQRVGNTEIQFVSMANRLDRMDLCIERIGRRLDPQDA